ncbi:hypothetical protein H8356DRAFT_1338654 [Neocallimastix lanati (nom. inval.)]|nr:hypothetical protein H8356DRAFT_1338654 [Neocallimastix sp. JGI-2020a]
MEIIFNNNANESTTEETNNAVIISLYGTSVFALVTIIGFILIKKKAFISLNYVSPKPNYPVGGLHDNLTNSNNDFKRNYQLRFYKLSISMMVHVSTWNKILMFSKPLKILQFHVYQEIYIDLQRDSPKESPPYNNQKDLLIIKHVD